MAADLQQYRQLRGLSRRTATQRLAQWARSDLGLVVVVGIASGLLYLVLYFVQRALFLNGFPTSGARPDQRDVGVPRVGNPADGGQLIWQLAGYYGATLALFALYVVIVRRCGRGELRAAWARRLALLFPVGFNLGLLFGLPTLSRDIYTYVAYGYVGTLPGGNPYAQVASNIADHAFGVDLLAAGWLPWHGVTPYGPFWTICEIAVLRLTQDVGLAVFLLKLLVVVASLSAGWIIWTILGRVRPEDQLLGTVAYLWSPLIILEFAGDGHNDALMLLCVMAALLASVRGRPVGTVVGLVLGALVKYLPVLFLPAQLVYFARNRQSHPRLLVRLLTGAAVSLGLTILLYRSVWIGLATYQAVPEGGQRVVTASLSGAVIWVLTHLLSQSWAAWLTAILLDSVVGIYVLVVSWRARDTDHLLRACAGIAVLGVLVASPFYWPWYVALPIALLALTPRDRLFPLAIALPLGARLVAPVTLLYENHFIPWAAGAVATVLLAILLPLALFVVLSVGPRRGWSWQLVPAVRRLPARPAEARERAAVRVPQSGD